MTNFKIKSNLSEKQIEADVATYFGWISPIGAQPFRLIAEDEQITGADKKFDSVIPIYMQFKVSDGLKPIRNITPPFSLSPLQRIRKFRNERELNDNPTLYFRLRNKAEFAEDFQHNILMRLAHTGSSEAFYVAPLTLDKADYERTLFDSQFRYLHHSPFTFTAKNTEIFVQNWVSYFGFTPFLRGHISITPHERVDTASHHYSFSTTGAEIAWHSPQLSLKASRLSDRLREIFRYFNMPDRWTSMNAYAEGLVGIKEEIRMRYNFEENRSPIERIQAFGRALYANYEIKQFLLVTTKEFLSTKSSL